MLLRIVRVLKVLNVVAYKKEVPKELIDTESTQTDPNPSSPESTESKVLGPNCTLPIKQIQEEYRKLTSPFLVHL